MSKIINKFKFPNDNNEYQINATQLEGKTLDEIKQEISSGEVPAHTHTYTPAGTINESVIEEVIAHSKAIDDMVTLPSLSVTHIEDDNALSFSWSAGDLTQDNVVTEIEANPVQPTFTGKPGETTSTGSNTPTNNGGTISASIAEDDWAALNIENCTYAQVILYNCDISCDSFGLKIYLEDEDVPTVPIKTLSYMNYAIGNNLTIEIINQRLIRICSEDEGLLLMARFNPCKYLILKPFTDDSQYTSSEGMSFEYFVTR